MSFFVFLISPFSDNGAIHCFGQRVDRFLFDRPRGGSYHTFIKAQKEVGGKIKLYAGQAHGIQPGMKLAVFNSNVTDIANSKRGCLVVNSVLTTTSILRRDLAQTLSLPAVFYASDTQYTGKNLKVVIEGLQDDADHPEWLQIAHEVTIHDRPHTSVSFNNGGVSFIWQGLEDDGHLRGRYLTAVQNLSTTQARNRIVRMLTNAARFTYHLSRSCSAQSLLAKGLRVEVMKRGEEGDKNLLENGCMTLVAKESAAYCLRIHNTTGVDLWPYVYAFDTPCFGICESFVESKICLWAKAE